VKPGGPPALFENERSLTSLRTLISKCRRELDLEKDLRGRTS